MRIRGVTAMYFSGTGKTKIMTMNAASLLAMKLGVPFAAIDFSLPDMREKTYEFGRDEVLVIGVPVYAGRVPNLLLPFLNNNIKGVGIIDGTCMESGNVHMLGTPCIPIVTFGNRSYDNALIELCNIMTDCGFSAVAAGAFCAQHSFSKTLGAGRPDGEDFFKGDELALVAAERLMKLGYRELTTLEKMQAASGIEFDEDTVPCSVDESIEIPVPVKGDPTAGYYQPRDRNGNPIDIRKVKPKTSDACTNCKLCAKICPMGAIDFDDVSKITGICIKCCACETRCPVSAKYFDDEGYLYHKSELEAMYGDVYAESEIF